MLERLVRWFRSWPPATQPIAYPLKYNGPGVYQTSFPGAAYAVVFEDDGTTGYVYATSARADEIYDALHVYDATDQDRLRPDTEAFIVWSRSTDRAGLFFGGRFHAVVDFRQKRACCRNGFPEMGSPWRCSHAWDPALVQGLD